MRTRTQDAVRAVLMVAGLALAIGRDAAAAGRTFRAGAHVIDVTPKKLPVIVNGGMRERMAKRIVDPLHARCLVLDDGITQIAFAIVDSCVIPRSIMDRAKELAHKTTGIPTEHMLIAATHAHSCPSVACVLGSGVQKDYAELLPGRIAEGIRLAHKNLAPARIGWAVGKDPTNVFCRRFVMKPGTARTCRFTGKKNDQAQMNPGHQNPNAVKRTGAADTDVPVVSVQSRTGKPLALLANYSTHYAGAPAISADYFGVFCRRMEERLGAGGLTPPFVAMMTNGTSGDTNCIDFVNPRRKFTYITVAEDVSQVAFDACKTIRYFDWVPLAAAEERLTLAIRKPDAAELAEAKAYLAEHKVDKPRNTTEVYAREAVILSEMPPTRELKLQAMRIGGLGIAAIPNEVFTSTGLTIKAKSPLRPTFTIELANGYDGYIPPPEQHKLGGYTTWRARSSCLEVDAEPKITAVVLRLLEKVAQHRRDEAPVPAK